MKRWLVLLAFTGCTAGIPRPTLLQARQANLELSTLEHGRSLFLARCGTCHLTPTPSAHTMDEWAKFVPEMSKDAELSEADAAHVLQFLQLFASNGLSSLPDTDAQRSQPDAK